MAVSKAKRKEEGKREKKHRRQWLQGEKLVLLLSRGKTCLTWLIEIRNANDLTIRSF